MTLSAAKAKFSAVVAVGGVERVDGEADQQVGRDRKNGGTTVRLRTLGVRANGALVAVIPCRSDAREPARLTGSRIRLNP